LAGREQLDAGAGDTPDPIERIAGMTTPAQRLLLNAGNCPATFVCVFDTPLFIVHAGTHWRSYTAGQCTSALG
jgi:hypothetical protein